MNKQEVFDVICHNTGEVIPRLKDHAFQYNDALRDLGANSVDRSEIVMMTLESLEINVPLIELARAENMGDLADILYAKL